jgi:hypothetical protein
MNRDVSPELTHIDATQLRAWDLLWRKLLLPEESHAGEKGEKNECEQKG